MKLPDALQSAMNHPSMFFQPVEFDVVVAFFEGFDTASSGGALVGLREWLITRLRYGNNLHWSALALYSIFPKAKSPRKQLTSKNQKRAVEDLFSLFKEFAVERAKPEGLRGIYLNYQKWLEKQSWYGPGSPQYIPVRRSRR